MAKSSSKAKPQAESFSSLAEVLAKITQAEEQLGKDTAQYRHWVKELTGHDPTKPMGPMDVVRIVQKVFHGA